MTVSKSDASSRLNHRHAVAPLTKSLPSLRWERNEPRNPFFKQLITTLASAWLLACSPPIFAAEITYFYDGDTVEINDDGQEFKLRINDIDAPEKNQSYGKKSRRALMQLCEFGEFQAQITGQDKYGRKLGKLVCRGEDASLYMVKNGYAWFYAHYSNDGNLAFAEQQARNNGLGLWHAKQQTEPWIWRKNHPH